MNTREIATEFRLSHWAQIMQERAASGQSIRAYCMANGIGTNVYFYWQRKLREAAAEQLGDAQRGQLQALVPSGWAAISASEEAVEQAGGLTLHVGGVEIQVHQGFDEELLASVCRALTPQC